MTPDQIIEVVTAFKNGKTIEARHKAMGDWHVAVPAWDFHQFDYRIKPEPLELWVNVFEDGSGFGYTNEASALNREGTHFARKAVLFREVIGTDAEDQQR